MFGVDYLKSHPDNQSVSERKNLGKIGLKFIQCETGLKIRLTNIHAMCGVFTALWSAQKDMVGDIQHIGTFGLV